MGGLGKTALTAKAARQMAGSFDFVIWRSLINAPPLREILRACLQLFGRQQLAKMPESLDAQLALLFEYLHNHRCLIVLDNAESIIQSAGQYRSGYEEYGQLFRRMSESRHNSCLLLTSREQPQDVARLERANPQVRSLNLAGVRVDAGQAILRTQGLSGEIEAVQELIRRYSGNPLALMLIAETIQELYAGDVAAFLHEDAPIFDDIREVLDQQFARLAPIEQAILCWLAIEREACSLQQLSDDLAPAISRRAVLEAINALRRRCLLETSSADAPDGAQGASGPSFTLQNVVTEYVSDYIIDHVCLEIEDSAPQLLTRHALIKAQSKEYVRQSQVRSILQPVAERLAARLGRQGVAERCRRLIANAAAHNRSLGTAPETLSICSCTWAPILRARAMPISAFGRPTCAERICAAWISVGRT